MSNAPTQNAEAPDPLIGQVFGGRYRVDARLGEGGLGAVYKGLQLNLEQVVAIKVIHPGRAGDALTVERFRNEARIYARLNSPYIVKIHDFGTEDDTLYIVMEFVPGIDLQHLAEQRNVLPPELLLRLCGQVCQGLSDAHAAGILHRDIKPANVMIRGADTDKPFATVLDFGLGKETSARETSAASVPKLSAERTALRNDLTLAGSVAGTPIYMAPEQWKGRPLDERTDIYAVGAMMYDLACGRPPFMTESLMELMNQVESAPVPPLPRAHIDPELCEVIERCLAKSPADRFQTAGEVHDALDRIGRRMLGPKFFSLLEADERYDEQEGFVPVSSASFGTDGTGADDAAKHVDVVKQICATLGKAYKLFGTYPASNPVFEQSADDVCSLLDAFFAQEEQLILTVDRFALYYAKKQVYEDTDVRSSHPFKLHTDGIRRLYFKRGMSRDEVKSYLDCLHAVSRGAANNIDVVTVLWERKLPHVHYHTVDDLVDSTSAMPMSISLGQWYGQERDRRSSREGPDGEGRQYTPAEQRDREEAARAVEADAQSDHLGRFIGSLIGVLVRSGDDSEIESIGRALEDLMRGVLASGDVKHAWMVMGPIRAVLKRTRDPRIEGALLPVLDIAAEPVAVHSVMASLEQSTDDPDYREAVRKYLLVLPRESSVHVLAALHGVREEDDLTMLKGVLLSMCSHDTEPLVSGVESRHADVALATLQVLGHLRHPDVVGRIASCFDHPAAEVRIEAMQLLARLGDHQIGRRIARMLKDDDATVRMAAVDIYAGMKNRAQQRPLLELLDPATIMSRSMDEQRQLFSVLGEVGGKDVLERIESHFLSERRPWYRRTKTLVLAGLGAILVTGVISIATMGKIIGSALTLGILLIIVPAGMQLPRVDGPYDAIAEPMALCLGRIGGPEAKRVLGRLGESGGPRARRAFERAQSRIGKGAK